VSVPAAAGQIYRWVDAAGRVHFGDNPQPGAQPVDVRVPGAAIATTPTVRFDPVICESKRKELGSYKTAQRLVERDALGREKEYTGEDRVRLIAKTEQDVAKACTEAPPPPEPEAPASESEPTDDESND